MDDRETVMRAVDLLVTRGGSAEIHEGEELMAVLAILRPEEYEMLKEFRKNKEEK